MAAWPLPENRPWEKLLRSWFDVMISLSVDLKRHQLRPSLGKAVFPGFSKLLMRLASHPRSADSSLNFKKMFTFLPGHEEEICILIR